mmetsp:Transcript_6250/g.17974  ORF Transcript_6250/g.17974 Transcript_6250/m.17974 type:complete len:185 (-) Transcript_6250:741-1295(-)
MRKRFHIFQSSQVAAMGASVAVVVAASTYILRQRRAVKEERETQAASADPPPSECGGKKVALLLVDHGSRLKAANDMIFDVARLVQGQRDDLIVDAAHMEIAEPNIPEVVDKCVKAGAEKIIVHPYMLAPGRHATKDIPKMVMDAMASHPSVEYEVTSCLGIHEKIGQVVLERAGLVAGAVAGA